jgi:hypothetical protein
VTPRPPRAYRLIPLLAGIAELAWFVDHRPPSTNGQLTAYLSGVLLIMVGLVFAGSWLTMAGARLMLRRARRPATLIAARRLADNPKAAFRAVSGLVLALYVSSVAVGVMTTIVAERGGHTGDPLAGGTVWQGFGDEGRPVAPGTPDAAVPDRVRALPGVRDVTVVHVNPLRDPHPAPVVRSAGSGPPPSDDVSVTTAYGLVACADLARTGSYGSCPAGADVAATDPHLVPFRELAGRAQARVWPAAPVSLDRLHSLPVLAVNVATDGSPAAIDRVRTALELGYPSSDPPSTEHENETDLTTTLAGWQQLASVVILTTLSIAGCSLAAGVAGGLSERKRPFSLLRLTGVPLRVLRRVVALESAVPLLVVSALAIGVGFLAAQLFLRSQMQYTLRAPGPGYWVAVVAGLVASLGIIASTLPLLRRITGPETARNE